MIISTPDVVSGAYRYVGCYQQVFYDSYFTSSYMEPNLCFRLCETPLIFIQDTVCRCSGSGLMHYDRHRDRYCSTPCRQPGNPQVKTTEKCGGTEMYSLYAEENFYTRHAHLLDYRIQYSSCQFWNRSDYYDTFKVNIDGSSTKSPLNRLETCAAACLDQNSTTTSIGFNGNDKQCSCIIPKQLNENSDRSLYLTILSTDKCDLHCKNIVTNSKVEHPFTCGSSTDQRIWAVYNLTDLCPTDSVYIKDLKHCMFANTDIFYSCPSPSVKYVYNGDLTWNTFLKVIKKFNLTKSIVSVDFDDAVIIDSSWKCPTNKTDNIIKSNISDTNYFQQSSSANYVLDNGCLRKSTYSVSSQMPVNYLCLTYPINKKSPLDDEAHLLGSYRYISRARVVCPPNWFDLNGQCYRMSNEPRKIQEAKNSCFNISESEEKENLGQIDRLLLDTEEKNELVKEFKKFISDYLKGEIVQYTSRWQARLGFYLLDTNVSTIESTNAKFEEAPMHSLSIPVIIPSPPVPAVGINVSSINEFQMINPNENNNSTMKDDSCIVVTRPMVDKQGSSILQTTQINHCSKPIHVLCRTKTKLAVPLHPVCLEKPLTLGLPAMISNYLTHELCLSVCKKLAVKVAVLHMNKCYCFNYALARSSILKPSYEKHQKQHCGNPCPGNQNEYCGNNNTVVAINSAGVTLSSIYDNIDIFKSLYPDFIHDACIHVDSAKQSTMYGFYLNRSSDVHPRHCLELCTKYEQKYALLNSNKCLCTNIQIKPRKTDSWFLPQDNNCTDECQGNYFYSCGNINNSSIYSVYSMQLNCPPGFQNAQDGQRCVHADAIEKTTSFSYAQSYCESVGGMIAKINDVLEIQQLLPKSTLTGGGFGIYSPVSQKTDQVNYFWINRTSDISHRDKTLDISIPKCSLKAPESLDRNCIAARYEKTIIDDAVSYDPCIFESNECSSMSAVPVCVDKHLKSDSTFIQLTEVGDGSIVSVNTTIDYSCGDDKDYHLVNGFCYKINVHEITWQEAKSQCERENAALFIPENFEALQLIKLLFLRRQSYTSSGFAHVGVTYDNKNSTIKKYNANNKSSVVTAVEITGPNILCEATFLLHYGQLVSSSILSTKDKERLKNEQIACAYVDVRSEDSDYVSCDDIRCNRSAAVICQKAPITEMRLVVAKSSPMNKQFNLHTSSKPVGRRFPLTLFLFVTVCVAILTGSICLLYNRYLKRNNNTRLRTARDNDDSIYSPLATGNDFDLH
ncbi:unnamed protein product [Rotaria magnacalcarata]